MIRWHDMSKHESSSSPVESTSVEGAADLFTEATSALSKLRNCCSCSLPGPPSSSRMVLISFFSCERNRRPCQPSCPCPAQHHHATHRSLRVRGTPGAMSSPCGPVRQTQWQTCSCRSVRSAGKRLPTCLYLMKLPRQSSGDSCSTSSSSCPNFIPAPDMTRGLHPAL